MQSVVVVGAPGSGKTAVWLALAAALGAAALRLETAAGADAAASAAPALAWPVARARFGAAAARHGVRVAQVLVPKAKGGGLWPLALRLVDGPGVAADGAGASGPEMARLLREMLGADLWLHVQGDPAGPVDAALDALARARGIPLEGVCVVRGGARGGASPPRLRLLADGSASAADARALAQRVRRRLGASARAGGMRWPRALP